MHPLRRFPNTVLNHDCGLSRCLILVEREESPSENGIDPRTTVTNILSSNLRRLTVSWEWALPKNSDMQFANEGGLGWVGRWSKDLEHIFSNRGFIIKIWLSGGDRLKARQSNTRTQELD